jgi:hypothetical protein
VHPADRDVGERTSSFVYLVNCPCSTNGADLFCGVVNATYRFALIGVAFGTAFPIIGSLVEASFRLGSI